MCSWVKMETMFNCLEMKEETLKLLSDCLRVYFTWMKIWGTQLIQEASKSSWETKVHLAKEEKKEEGWRSLYKCPLTNSFSITMQLFFWSFLKK